MSAVAAIADADWVQDAACLDEDPELWFAFEDSAQADAKAICRECPVRNACLAHAVEHHETEGIWGGKTPRELDRFRRRLRQLNRA